MLTPSVDIDDFMKYNSSSYMTDFMNGFTKGFFSIGK